MPNPSPSVLARRASGRQRYREAREQGLCVQCRRIPPIAERSLCARCAARRREQQAEYRAKQRRIADLFAEQERAQ